MLGMSAGFAKFSSLSTAFQTFFWSYAEMDQLIGRTYRRGQTQEVTVIFFLLIGSIDERMHAVAASKVVTAASLLGESATVTRLGPDGDLTASADDARVFIDDHLNAGSLPSGNGELHRSRASQTNHGIVGTNPNCANPDARNLTSNVQGPQSTLLTAPWLQDTHIDDAPRTLGATGSHASLSPFPQVLPGEFSPHLLPTSSDRLLILIPVLTYPRPRGRAGEPQKCRVLHFDLRAGVLRYTACAIVYDDWEHNLGTAAT